MSLRRPLPRALVAIGLCIVSGVATSPPTARAAGLEDLRRRAQEVADEITSLEVRLQDLRAERERLDARITSLTQGLALLQRTIDRWARRVAAARSRYVERAVEVYKGGGASHWEALLAAGDLNELLDIAEAVSRAASADADALRGLRGALEAQRRAQAQIDSRKQRLLAAQAANEEVSASMEQALLSRGEALAELNARIEALEQEARLRAARAATSVEYGDNLSELLAGTGPAADLPEGYVGTGIVFEGIASWYGPGFAGETTANGQIFDPRLFTAASRDLPFGTTLWVRHEGRGVIVVINDRGPYLDERILDLSRAAAEAIGLGLGWVEAEIVLPVRA